MAQSWQRRGLAPLAELEEPEDRAADLNTVEIPDFVWATDRTARYTAELLELFGSGSDTWLNLE